MASPLHQVIGARRASWRVLSSIEAQGHEDKRSLISTYKKDIEAELVKICDGILKVMEDKLIPTSTSEEGKVNLSRRK